MATAEIRRHWSRLAEMGCVCCGRPAQIAHCHGGSLLDRGVYRAKGRKPSDWLTLPICVEHHSDQYPGGLDRDVRAWEERWGPQYDYLKHIGKQLGVDVFVMAGLPEAHWDP